MIQKIKLNEIGLNELSKGEIQTICGGGLFEWVGEAIGVVAHSLYIMGTVGGAYQQSLPSDLKK